MQNGACEKGRRHCAPVARGQSAVAVRLSSLLRAKREPEKYQRRAPVRGAERFYVKWNCSLLMSKENQKTTSDFDALDPTGCGSQRLLRCRSHPAGRCPNSSSLYPPLAAVVAVARKGLLAPFRPRRGGRSPKMLAASLNAFFGLLRFTAPPMVLRFRRTLRSAKA